MCGGDADNPPVKALDINYPTDSEGDYLFNEMPSIVPVSFLDWCVLPIRDYDRVINSSKLKLRIPSVVISVNYHKIPKKKFRPNVTTLLQLQKNRCGFTNKPLSRKRATLEHKTPKSFSGAETFQNLIAVDRDLNHRRGNRPYSEFEYKPLYNHTEPAPIPVSFTVDTGLNYDWRWFTESKGRTKNFLHID